MQIVSSVVLEEVDNLDLGCEFQDGVCRGMLGEDIAGLKNSVKACCAGCYENAGYFGMTAEHLPKEYKAQFKKPDGFWKNGGCCLPKEKRSVKCTVYVCPDSGASDETRVLLKELEHLI